MRSWMSVTSAAPFTIQGCNPDFLNVDLTMTRKFAPWEFGVVAFGSTDLNEPLANYAKQSRIAVGGLIGRDFNGLDPAGLCDGGVLRPVVTVARTLPRSRDPATAPERRRTNRAMSVLDLTGLPEVGRDRAISGQHVLNASASYLDANCHQVGQRVRRSYSGSASQRAILDQVCKRVDAPMNSPRCVPATASARI